VTGRAWVAAEIEATGFIGKNEKAAHECSRACVTQQSRSCTTSRLRCSGLRLNARTASASAASRLGASTFLRISDPRQERDAMARGIRAERNLQNVAHIVAQPPFQSLDCVSKLTYTID
jgi:hypothetical protein